MRPQSPKMLQTQTIATTRIVNSPPRDTRQDSSSRLAKVTTCQTRPKVTITTIPNKPIIETRTVVLCNDKKCQAHENHIEQLTQENYKLNQRIHDLELQIDKFDGEQQIWMSTAIEIESLRKLLEETQKNHQKEIQSLNSELYNVKSLCQTQDEKIQSLNSQIKTKQHFEEGYLTLTQEIEKYKFINQDKDEQLQQQDDRIKDYEKQLQLGENVIEERNSQIQVLLEKNQQYQLEFETSNNVIHQLKQEILQKDNQNQQLLSQKDSLISNYRENLDLLEQKVQQEQHLDVQKNLQLIKLENEKEDLNKIIGNLQSQLKDFQEQNNQLNQQLILNDQLNFELQASVENQTKSFEFQLQSKSNEHELSNQEKLQLQEELYKSKQESEDKENLIISLKNDIIVLTNQITGKDEKIEILYQELNQQVVQTVLYNNKQLQNYLIINEELKKELKQSVSSAKSVQNDLQKEIENRNQLLEMLNQSKVQIQELQNIKSSLENELLNQRQQNENQNIENEKETLQLSDSIKSFQKQISEISEEKTQLENTLVQLTNETQIEIKQLWETVQLSKQNEEKLSEANQEQQEQLLLQSLEVQRLQNENKNLKEIQQQQSQEIEKLNEQSTQVFENKLQLQVEQDKQIDQLQNKIQEFSILCEKLQSDLKLQNEVNEELNKRNQFNQAQISHLQEVESQLRYLNEQSNQQQKNLQKALENKNETENTLKFKLDTLLEDIKVKQMQLSELDRQLQIVEQTSQSQQINLEDRINYLQNEVEMWKEKFVILNRDYHRVQEDLMMVQAEYEAVNKRSFELKNIKESACFEVRKSSLYKENIDVKSSQTSIGKLFKENF
ncbi:unnamed protein product [Paramecium sonneborni]|uniref:Uncharacterized protein n=1 Tax=Paramecium sonneborni TaxID=65129 RepID=A0A8S1NBM8_9CILI|nr:unnamed protein product [Paramecium sonneborni]